MFYLVISVCIYLLSILFFLYLLKRPDADSKKEKFAKTFIREATKGLSKRDVKSRKKRVRVLPLYQRFLYWLWFSSVLILVVVFPVVFYLVRWFLLHEWIVPADAIHSEISSLSLLFFNIGGFLLGVPLLVFYSFLTNRGVIRKADLLYQLGSFEDYPSKGNIFISGLLGLLGLLLILMASNSYRYCTDDAITIKEALSFQKQTYSYSQILHVKKKTYTNGHMRYTFITKDGKRFSFENGVFKAGFETFLQGKNLVIYEHK